MHRQFWVWLSISYSPLSSYSFSVGIILNGFAKYTTHHEIILNIETEGTVVFIIVHIENKKTLKT